MNQLMGFGLPKRTGIAGVVLLVVLGLARPSLEGAAEAAVSSETIARWVAELNADRYLARQLATDRLVAAGEPVIRPVAKALEACSREVATRGVYVLRELALSDDVPTQELALATLERLSKTAPRPVAHLALESLAAMGKARQARAVVQLQELGAEIHVVARAFGFEQFTLMSVEIGPAWEGKPEDLARLKWLPDVQDITFVGARVTDEWLEPVSHLENLVTLTARRTSITDAALCSVQNLKRLTYISLLYTPVTDVGLEHLQQIKSARVIRIYGTRISEDAVARYLEKMAHVQIDFRRGAFLGVQCQQRRWPCEVLSVVPESAADHAGIRPADVIIRYRDQPISDFEELRGQIALNQVDDTVTIRVARGADILHASLIRAKEEPFGIEGEMVSYGCRVTRVLPGGTAARNGLRVGDIVAQFDEARVTSCEQLQQAFLQTADQAQSEVGVLRDVKQLVDVNVTFGEWTE